jgi:hypothetical protein
MKKIRPNIKYRDAWEAYDRRWALAWAGTLIFVLTLGFTVAGPQGETSPLPLIGAILLFFLLYLRFMLWHCPRCGHIFSLPGLRSLARGSECQSCHLPRLKV